MVSSICKLIDEDIAGTEFFTGKAAAWTEKGFLEAVKILIKEKNTLFESLIGKLNDYPELNSIIQTILFAGRSIPYNTDTQAIDIAAMFGFIKEQNGNVVIANKIFEARLYNLYLSTEETRNAPIFKTASRNKNQFIQDGRLDMDLVIDKYVEYFKEIYGEHYERFDESEGRRRFLMFIKPIINGTGNFDIEPQTRDESRMDVVIDYNGERFIVEMKLWRRRAYNEKGEKQLIDYLSYYNLKKGYLLSYNFNKNKEIGVHRVQIGKSILVEAVI